MSRTSKLSEKEDDDEDNESGQEGEEDEDGTIKQQDLIVRFNLCLCISLTLRAI